MQLSASQSEWFGGGEIIPVPAHNSIHKVIDSRQNYVRMLGNSSKKIMNNDVTDFSILKYFGVSTRSRKASHPIQVV